MTARLHMLEEDRMKLYLIDSQEPQSFCSALHASQHVNLQKHHTLVRLCTAVMAGHWRGS